MSGVKGTRKKESEALAESDGLCSSEHGLRGIGFGGSPIGYAGFMSRFKVQGNFLLLCPSNNFVGYSYIYIRIIIELIHLQDVTTPPPTHPPQKKRGGWISSSKQNA